MSKVDRKENQSGNQEPTVSPAGLDRRFTYAHSGPAKFIGYFLTRLIWISSVLAFLFIIARAGVGAVDPPIAVFADNLFIFFAAGFSIMASRNIVFSLILLLAALPVIYFDILYWNVPLSSMETKSGWEYVIIYCIVGILMTVAYLVMKVGGWIGRYVDWKSLGWRTN